MRITATAVLLLLGTQFLQAQTTKADKKTIAQLRADIGYLASDELEGRRTGTEGEAKARTYIEQRYKKLGIQPFRGQYAHPFSFVAGREAGAATRLKMGKDNLKLGKEAFLLPFSGDGRAQGEVVPDVMEQGNIWLLPLYKDADQAGDPHFDWEKEAYEKAKDAAKHGATAILFYDSYGAKFEPEFNSRSEYEPLSIPAFVVKYTFSQVHIANDNLPIELNAILSRTNKTAQNIAAYIDNGAPYTAIIGAHYDHLGLGEDGNSLLANASKLHQIHNGADDNASGTAAVLQLAERIKKDKLKKYNYLFLHFSGEELGLLGSKAFIKDLSMDSSKMAYMVNLDMVGRLNDSSKAITIGGIGTSPVWGSVLPQKPFRIVVDSSGIGPSDHTSFYNTGVPVLFFFTGTHPDYHKPTDDADKINCDGEALIVSYIEGVVKQLDSRPKPQYTTTKQSSVGRVRFKVTLGIMPDYAYQDKGVKVDGVSDGRPAQKAGVKVGDVITQLGEVKIQGMQSYMEALSTFKEGDKTEVKLQRAGKELVLPIEFK